MGEAAHQPVILSAARTAIGRFQGSLSSIPAPRLGAMAIKAAVARAGISELDKIDEVIMGNVVTAGLGQAPARQAAIFAGLPAEVGALTINKVCGSGLKAVMLAAQAIRAGDGALFVAGGQENMSRAPFLVDARTGGLRYGNAQLTDALLRDGLWDPFEDWSMGDSAEFIAQEFDISRQEMDHFAYQSHQRALQAIEQGWFKDEIVPVELAGKKGAATVFAQDEGPRADTSLEALAALRPAFQKDGRVTAGNAPGLNDGAAALVVASEAEAQRQGAAPMARIVGYAQAAVAPKYLFNAPAVALPKLLERVGWSLDDVDLIELNEAFAAQVLANGKALTQLGWNWDKVNRQGGAIALGHPIGASGARILTTLLFGLRRLGLRRGIAALCLGGAESVAIAVEMYPEA